MSSTSKHDDFWQEKSLDELAHEQGLEEQRPVDELIGHARDLWESDEEFDQFIAQIHERRYEPSAK
jgi:hypothetical protein